MTDAPSVALPVGYRAAGIRAGIKKRGAPDLALLLAPDDTVGAAIYTRSRLVGAHIPICRDHLQRSGGRVRAILVNSGNANCATGEQGLRDARGLCARLADLIECDAAEVLMLSTGVIGAQLPVGKIETALPSLIEACRPDGFIDFAEAIRTTDTHRKVAHVDLEGSFRVVGAAKGSGMIHPDMATMLAFLVTDAPLPTDTRALLTATADETFHRLSVDGDTSPNDTFLLLGRRASTPPTAADTQPIHRALVDVGRSLARKIARDGEGASRLVTVEVREASSDAEAAAVGRVIATSPLVKTAIYGRDPNWGRILSAAARAGVPFSTDAATLWIGDAILFRHGTPDVTQEGAAHDHLTQSDEVRIGVSLGLGQGSADVWTCDFSPEYVHINADYRT